MFCLLVSLTKSLFQSLFLHLRKPGTDTHSRILGEACCSVLRTHTPTAQINKGKVFRERGAVKAASSAVAGEEAAVQPCSLSGSQGSQADPGAERSRSAPGASQEPLWALRCAWALTWLCKMESPACFWLCRGFHVSNETNFSLCLALTCLISLRGHVFHPENKQLQKAKQTEGRERTPSCSHS